MEEDGIGSQLLSILSFHPSSFVQVINSVEKTHLILLLLLLLLQNLWCSTLLVSSEPSTSPITHMGRGLMLTNYPLHIILDNFAGCNIPRIVSGDLLATCHYNMCTKNRPNEGFPSYTMAQLTYLHVLYGLASYLEHHLQGGALARASRSICDIHNRVLNYSPILILIWKHEKLDNVKGATI